MASAETPKSRSGVAAWFGELDRLLRGELTRSESLRGGGLGITPWRMAVLILALSASYGLCMGTFAAFQGRSTALMQVVASTVKVPLLFFLTLLVTFPSLYVFNALVGSRLEPGAVGRLLIAALGVMTAVQASLGPITAFFSLSTTSYPFMLLLNVAVFAVSGFLGLSFLLQTLHRLDAQPPAPPPRPVAPDPPPEPLIDPLSEPLADPLSEPLLGPLDRFGARPITPRVQTVFRIWMVVFSLVGAQMGWVLRPFVGNPNLPFSWFRERQHNFFVGVLEALGRLLSN